MDMYQHLSFKKNWEITLAISKILGECEAMVRAIANTPLRPQDRKKLLVLSLIKGAQATTAIEGNTLSQEESETAMDEPAGLSSFIFCYGPDCQV